VEPGVVILVISLGVEGVTSLGVAGVVSLDGGPGPVTRGRFSPFGASTTCVLSEM